MLRTIFCTAGLALLLAAGAAQAQDQGSDQSVDQSTSWKVTVTGQMTEPFQRAIPEQTNTTCGPAEPLSEAPPVNQGKCQIEDYEKSGNRASYKLVCKMPMGTMQGDGWAEMVDHDHYEGHMTISGEVVGKTMAMQMDYTGERVGLCEDGQAG